MWVWRLEWDCDGELSDNEHFFLGDETVMIWTMEARFGTVSMAKMWRHAHPQLGGTE